MSAFAALTGFGGDDDIVEETKKKKLQQEEETKKREAAASKSSMLAFDDFKAKAGQANWGDSDEEDDAFFSSKPVRRATATLRAHGLSDAPGPCKPGGGADRAGASLLPSALRA